MTLMRTALHALTRDVGPGLRDFNAVIATRLNLNNNVSLQQAGD